MVSRLQAIDVLLGNIIPSIKDNNSTVRIPKNYDSNLTWEDKCLFIVNEKESIYSAGIVNEVLQREPDRDKKKISTSVSQALTRLKNENKVIVPTSSGRKFNYQINKELSLL